MASDEVARVGAVGTPPGAGTGLAAPTILTHGSDTIKGLLLERILTGEDGWCQLFSEPGSGSDLAGLTTTARRDGDEWVIDGQKLWSTERAPRGAGAAVGPHRLGRAEAPWHHAASRCRCTSPVWRRGPSAR